MPETSHPEINLPIGWEEDEKEMRRDSARDLLRKEYPELEWKEDMDKDPLTEQILEAHEAVSAYCGSQYSNKQDELKRTAEAKLEALASLNNPVYQNFIVKETEKISNAPTEWAEQDKEGL